MLAKPGPLAHVRSPFHKVERQFSRIQNQLQVNFHLKRKRPQEITTNLTGAEAGAGVVGACAFGAETGAGAGAGAGVGWTLGGV